MIHIMYIHIIYGAYIASFASLLNVADSCSFSHSTGTYVFGILDCGECPISWSSYGEVLLLHPTEEMKM